jgi:anti-sigma regulatory factor (Ser/Thr protein kinase)
VPQQPALCEDLDFDAGPEMLSVARRHLAAWLIQSGLTEPGLHELLTAFGEAAANAYEHSGAQCCGAAPAACLRARVDAGQVRVTVSDRGHWKTPTGDDETRGRGRSMMAALADAVYLHTGPDGTTVQMIKKLPV